MIAEKGLVCEERDVSLPQSEHKEPWFMRLNLGEEVPVIIHRDNIISDYDQIIDYVERTFTGGTVAAPLGAGPEPWQAGRKLWGRGQGPVCPERSHRATGKPQMPPRNCIATDPQGTHNPPPWYSGKGHGPHSTTPRGALGLQLPFPGTLESQAWPQIFGGPSGTSRTQTPF